MSRWCHVSRGRTHLVQGERHDGVILLQHGLVTQLLEVVRSDSVMRVRGQNVLPVLSAHMSVFHVSRPAGHPPVGEAVHPHPLPAVEDGAVAVTLIELASVAATGQPLAVRTPGYTGEAVLVTVRHFRLCRINPSQNCLAGGSNV